MSEPGPTPVCILGMHRSGTSNLAGSLEQHGLRLGDVVQSAPHNEKGNREHLGIRALNDAVLHQSDAAWDHPPRRVLWTPALTAARDALIDHFTAHSTAESGPWGFKDPRTVLTLEFWQAPAREWRYVATFRHPMAVARSLEARDGTPLPQGVQLWLAYNRRILAEYDRRPFPLVDFDLDGARYVPIIAALARTLGLRAADAARPFFEDRLRHHRPAEDDMPPDTAVRETYERLRRHALIP